jgi:hypothetical protein
MDWNDYLSMQHQTGGPVEYASEADFLATSRLVNVKNDWFARSMISGALEARLGLNTKKVFRGGRVQRVIVQ